MAFDRTIEGMDGEIGFSVGAETVVEALLAPEITRRHFAQAENLSIKPQHHFGIEGVVGNVSNARKFLFFVLGNAETVGRDTDRQTLRIVNAELAVMDVARFRENHAARIEVQKFPLDRFEIIDLQANVMQADI